MAEGSMEETDAPSSMSVQRGIDAVVKAAVRAAAEGRAGHMFFGGPVPEPHLGTKKPATH
ncbi:MAG: hypothetical protein QG621_410 [Patescibacteria group bacterium]|nr:hypothetical protein [Patescibacteria group bacterium]